MTVSVH